MVALSKVPFKTKQVRVNYLPGPVLIAVRYCTGFLVVSFLAVSGLVVVSVLAVSVPDAGVAIFEVSVLVLSAPLVVFDELQPAAIAPIIVATSAKLKICFFIVICI
jgi:hypothetical protein